MVAGRVREQVDLRLRHFVPPAEADVLADKPGTYLYGCFFHYTAPMRGAIIAQ